jgi:hypothetical protein
MKDAYEELLEGEFGKTMNVVITHLPPQNNLIADIGQRAVPKLTSRWVIIGVVCEWLLQKQSRVVEHFNNADNFKNARLQGHSGLLLQWSTH